MKKTILAFGLLIGALLVLFQMSKYALVIGNGRIEWIIAIIAVVFFAVGLIINKRRKNQAASLEQKTLDTQKIREMGITAREYEILEKMADGLSNKEIGEALFVTESTVKTHVSNLFVKLDAKRRTQAVQKAKDLNILV